MSVEVCALLPKFKLTLIRVEPLTDAKQDVQKIEKLPSFPERVEGLAYVLHTSGTTGLPKIVRVPHNCILPNILHLRHLFSVSCGDVVFLASPLTFDPSVVDLFLALSSGARLLVVPAVLKKIPKRLCQLLFRRHKTTLMQVIPIRTVTPTLLSRFGPRLLRQEVLSRGSSLRVLALGGEACPSVSMLNAWRHEDNATAVFNVYGVTEVSCWATCYQIPPSVFRQPDGSASFAVPLGSPLTGTRVEVRDQDGGVVTEGEGEVFIGGDERVCLLDHEDSAVPGTMRATGDRVEVRGGQMYYLGRKDRSIKRHGKRVNLDHLQQMLSNLPEVESCAVCLHDDSRLLAFVVLAASGGSEDAGSPFSSELSRHLQKQLTPLLPSYAIPDTVVHDALGLDGNAKLDDGSRFLFGGGDSLQALRLCEDILAATGVGSPRILEAVLDGTFADVLRLVVVPGKRERERSWPLKVFKGESEMTEMRSEGRSVLVLNERWSSDTGRCVDASPTLLVREGQDSIRTAVFIGSHSHRMQALDLDSGHLLWERVLGGRVEASAGVSPCGRYVVVGCYDGNVYVLSADSGETRWVFETGDAVKSRPAADPLTGRMMVGSHDGFVYALDLQRCVWRRHCGGGAIFSSPYLDAARRQLYVATLGGKLLCLHPDSGEVLWSHSRDVPFFSSPKCGGDGGRVAIGSVDRNILCFSHDGTLVWQFRTDGAVFSSPCATSDLARLLCGSHDGRLYCLNAADGSLLWTFQTAGKVFASPCAFDSGMRGELVGVASTDGTVYVLDARNGLALCSRTLPGELFSSPVVCQRSLVVGCRNDYVYCLQIGI
uniref:Aminoadipate-semialdehyde dehydrogenase n=1 Tax=Hippocampus comes TaxID=109280 RepID=A0A3Q3DII4_HIPCM